MHKGVLVHQFVQLFLDKSHKRRVNKQMRRVEILDNKAAALGCFELGVNMQDELLHSGITTITGQTCVS